MADRRAKVGWAVVFAGGLGLFALHAALYAAWLIDDAGISIAYATNLANGLGLVAQPGAAPVEGYSNPSWVLVLAALARANLLLLPGTLKVLGGLLVAAAYAIVLRLASRVASRPQLVGAAALLLCSANPSFVIWCTSGLENPLYALAILGLAELTLVATTADSRQRTPLAAALGLVAALVATTRPDGVLYAVLPAALLLAFGAGSRRALSAYAAALLVPILLFFVARLATFHALVPNTYVAKGGLRVADAFDLPKLGGLASAAFTTPAAYVILASAAGALLVLARRRALPPPLVTVLAFTFVAVLDFQLLPRDRMDEERFATPVYPLLYLSVFALLDRTVAVYGAPRPRFTLCAAALGILAACAPDFSGRAFFFARAPSIGLFYVRRAFAERIDRYAAALAVRDASALLPDVGGMLLFSHVRVVDLAGLCDATLARTLTRDPASARAYVLSQARPTFIHAADIWAKAIALDEDPRFATDYVAIHAYSRVEDPASDGHAAGLYVRRDAVEAAGGESALTPLRSERHFRLAFLPPPADSMLLRWLDATPLVPATYRARLSWILREKS